MTSPTFPLPKPILLCVLLAAVTGTAVAQFQPKREMRAAWIATVANLDWPSSAGISPDQARAQFVSILDGLQDVGINTVIFQVRTECDALYDSPFEPWSYYLTGSQGLPPSPYYDPLEFAVSEAHARGMELHAWFNPYRAYRQTNTYPVAPGHVTVQHPSWVLTCPDGYKIIDPGLPEVQSFVAGVVTDVVRRYDIDGVHCDDYFYPYPEHNFTNQDAATFANHPRGFTNLGDWRRDNVNLLLRMIRDSVRATRPSVKIGMSPFGIWRPNSPPGISGLDAYATIYCDATAWLREGSIDYLTPQLYWQIGGNQNYAALVAWWADSAAARGRHLYPGMAPYRIVPYNWSPSELPNMIRINRGNPKISGEVFFRAKVGVLDNQKGFADTLKSDFYRHLSLLPVMAWKDSVLPFPPRGIRYAAAAGGGMSLQWELPLTSPDGDSASRYAVYRFDQYPGAGDLADPARLVHIGPKREYSPPIPEGATGPVYYLATALDRNWNESDTSNVVRIAAPGPPLLAAPADGATGLPDRVTVVWRSVPLAASYRLQVGTDPAFSTGLLVDQSAIADTFRVLTNLVGEATHFWRVRAGNAGGTGDFSAAAQFVTGFPVPVALWSPPNFADGVPVNLTLQWSGNPVATSYRIQLSTGSTFATTIVDSSGVADTLFDVAGLQYLRVYFWRVLAENVLGSSVWSEAFRFRTEQQPAAVAEGGEIPTEYRLDQNYPNPFNPVTTVRYALPRAGHVVVRVYDLLGREEKTLVDELAAPGTYTVQWDASSSSSGVYFVRLTADSFTATKRMMLVR